MVFQKNQDTNIKSIGQIFTPSHIAEFMVNNLINFIHNSNRTPDSLKILEPSVGEGVFLEYIQKSFSDITAYEMDRSLEKNLLSNLDLDSLCNILKVRRLR